MYLYEYVNRCIAIHTYDYDKPEEKSIRMAFLRAFVVCHKAKSKKILHRCIAIHTYDYDKPEEKSIRMAFLRAFVVCHKAKSKKILREVCVSC